ncbi:S-adenosyl-L-methionine-dependent methyltransferase [Radiomyces spectabilis]|uniref:S-adenosyl-L-methionine-dependent methyltransferase n=1 Tax=Radiomyces spectabilis TaxID=64574 RepID=UPI002220F9E0|nr:S-adenosyl-L-methionine-dependent methyltransferase [Radiomyces spectabilis]KAI8393943.1 S-adenosyl-L-methionine-dependent methyltransferase [Radiomyces spectabilis]
MSASSSLEAHGLSDMQNAAENTVFPESGHQRPNDPLYGVDVSWTPKYRSEQMLLDVYTLNNSEKQRRKERDRQQRQHYLLKHTWKGNYGVPLRSPSLIVNWCCGTGIWAMELAHKFPECHVVGIDYPSATMSKLSSAHNNLEFQHMLPHEEHTGLEQFEDNCVDYLMMRDVWLSNSPHHKWRQIMQQVMRILKPGGWLEIYEQDLEIYSAGAHLQTLDRWMDTLLEHLGIEKQLVHLITPLLKETGYQNVQERAMELPLGEWTSTDVMKETGYLFKDLIERRFRILRPWLSELNNVSNEEILNTITQGLDECETSKTHMCWYYYAAQKPGNI